MVAPKKPVPMCVVSIGYSLDLLLPTADGMKLIEILQRSVEVCRDYVGSAVGHLYTMKEQPNAELATVTARQIRAPRGADGVVSIEDRRVG